MKGKYRRINNQTCRGKLIKEKQERVKLQKKKDSIRRNAPKIICNAIYVTHNLKLDV